MSAWTETTRVQRTGRHVETTIDGEVVLMDVESGVFFVLKDSAFRIWKLTADGDRVGDVVDRLRLEYDVDRETCLADTLDMMKELHSREIITLQPGGT